MDFKAQDTIRKLRLQLSSERKLTRSARKLFDRSMDLLPDYTDGRNDSLTDAIQKWIKQHDAAGES